MVGNASIAWGAPAWAPSHPDDVEEDADEPPELRCQKTIPEHFRRTTVRRPGEQTSLLTKAIMSIPEDESQDGNDGQRFAPDLSRRRSMASNVSIASTADLTSDTGLTSPARTNTPSPPLPGKMVSHLSSMPGQKDITIVGRGIAARPQPGTDGKPQEGTRLAPQDGPRKRSIQFACTAKPPAEQGAARPPPVKTTSAQGTSRRPCVKFACTARPSTIQNTPPRETTATPRVSPKAKRPESPSTPRKSSALTTGPATPRPASSFRKPSSAGARPKFLRANSSDLVNEGSHFHEFACGNSREDDWIRTDSSSAKCRLTIEDTLTKENRIRRLGKEAEEEAEQEEDEEEAVLDDDNDDDDDDDDDDDGEDADDQEDEDDEDDDEDGDDQDGSSLSEGYRTDEETGFASSDESDVEENANMVLWTLSKSPAMRPNPYVPLVRRPSLNGHHSDSSTTSTSKRRSKNKRIKPQNEAPDLPDSTDFVCGTLDEDRALEEAYFSCLAARRNQKLRIIPQDIDPSFPAEEPEDEDDEDIYNPVHRDSDDDDFTHGRMEDLHHETDRSRRRRKSSQASPRRYHSPPPKRQVSPPPKARGRSSPKPLFHRHSPRRMRSPAPKAMVTPQGSPRQGNHVKFNLAARPGLTATKSLPRAGVVFAAAQSRQHRNAHKSEEDDDTHLRGAIDIVKGLEGKRQRRREKFFKKYCDRARRGQIPERKPQPGRGAERMKELGLLMAGKKDQGNYVISI